MKGWCYTLEDRLTMVVQPEGGSSILRVRLREEPDAASLRAILRASAQRPVPVEFTPRQWDQDSGCFLDGECHSAG